jgi:site-specific DNA-methyltransferase (adenine-specific)/adenine-specific DNA-methyltransferase
MLNWRGKRPFTSTQYYPAQLKEVHGDEVDGWRNKIYWGDNLQVMSHLLKTFRGNIDLIYVDPPFDSKADYKKLIEVKTGKTTSDMAAFEEKQYADIWTNDEYLQYMYERIVLMREMLGDRGILFLHCDWHKSHYLRCILDEVFGYENFVNEIIWQKCNSKNFTSNSLSNVHDNIFMYSKSRDHVFNEIFEELREEYIENAYRNRDADGKRYRLLPLHAPGERRGPTGEPWRGIRPLSGAHWRFAPETLDEMDAKKLIQKSETGVLSYKKYLEDSLGARVGTIWLDAKQLPGTEKTGYPTQKPESIIDKIIRIGSPPDGIVFDCFMGSGTTQAAAMKLGRRFIGADINLGAIQTTTKRLIQVAADLSEKKLDTTITPFVGFEVYNVNHYDIFRNPAQARDLLIEALEVQKLELATVFDGEKDGRMVKVMPVNRIATRADLNELIAGFDYKAWDRRHNENLTRPVEKILLVCMGHEPDLKAQLELAVKPYKIDVEVVDILRDKANLEFKRDSEAKVAVKKGELIVERFYPMNLLQKLSLQKEAVDDWRELVESVLIDWNYDGAVLQPAVVDIPDENELVQGRYKVPADAGTIRVKITDLLSESWEGSLVNG